MKVCSVENCEKPLLARGWCSAHYSLWRKHGKPERDIGRHGRGPKDPTYLSWTAMTARCRTGKYKSRFDVCDEWLGPEGFSNFLKDMGERPGGRTLDRINNDEGYRADNCRWADPLTQRLNSPQIKLVTYNGRTMPLSELCKHMNAPYNPILKRLRRGWSIDKAIDTPLLSTKKEGN